MRRRDLLALAAAGLPLAVLLFAAGVWVGGSSRPESAAPRAAETAAAGRAMFSPKVLDDPYFVEQQRRNVAALEQQCAERGAMCAEARAARRWLDGQAAD